MSKKKNKHFVFNDENQQNSYGFYILTGGIDTTRFEKNPVMLDSHYNSTNAVLGAWEELQKENGQLKGVPKFDTEDTDTQKIAGKVERGIIKGCSMGIIFNPNDLKMIDGKLTLTKCELLECSIVAVPSNANAIRLYTEEITAPLTSKEIKSLCLAVTPITDTKKPKNNENNMKIKLQTAAALALGLATGTNEIEAEELSQKIIELNASKEATEIKLQAKLDAEETAKLEAINKQVDDAITSGKISAEKKDKFVNLGIASPELLNETLMAIPAKTSLGAVIVPKGGNADTEVKTKEDFQKLSVEAQLQFKATNPEKYKQLFTKK